MMPVVVTPKALRGFGISPEKTPVASVASQDALGPALEDEPMPEAAGGALGRRVPVRRHAGIAQTVTGYDIANTSNADSCSASGGDCARSDRSCQPGAAALAGRRTRWVSSDCPGVDSISCPCSRLAARAAVHAWISPGCPGVDSISCPCSRLAPQCVHGSRPAVPVSTQWPLGAAFLENTGAATLSISTFTHAGRPLASARARAASRSAGSVTCSPWHPNPAAARS